MNPWHLVRAARRILPFSNQIARVEVKRRPLHVESLERRELLAIDSMSGLHNSTLPTDVNGDGYTTAADVQAILDSLNARGAHRMSMAASMVASAALPGQASAATLPDVNNDGIVSPLDALMVLSQLNTQNENALAKVEIEITDLDGNSIVRTQAGQKFLLKVYVDDIQPGNDDEGVYSAYVDVLFDATLASVDGAIIHAPEYSVAPLGDTSIDGVISTAGGTWTSLTAPGTQKRLLFTVPMKTEDIGTLNFQTAFSNVSGADFTVYGISDRALEAEDIDFGVASLEVYLPVLSIAHSDVVITEAGATTMTFTITLDEPVIDAATAFVITQELTGAPDAAIEGIDFIGKQSIIIFDAGESQKTFTVNINGNPPSSDKRFAVIVSDFSGVVGGQLIAVGTIIYEDVLVLPTVTIESPDPIVEGDTGTQELLFTVRLSEASDDEVTVDFETVEGTALAGIDFVARTGSVTFAPGETEKTIAIEIIGDTIPELLEEMFTVRLIGASGGVVSETEFEAEGTIVDDDPAPTIFFDEETVEIVEGDVGTQAMEFIVRLSGPSELTVSVPYETMGINATGGETAETPGADFVSQAGVLVFAPGEVEKTISILIIGDTAIEGDEGFLVILDANEAVNATVAGSGLAAGVIYEDDFPTLTVSDVEIVKPTSGTSEVVFVITLSEFPEFPVVLDYTTQDVTATAGEDYEAKSGQLIIPPDVLQMTITVTVYSSAVIEGSETFKLLLTAVEGTATTTAEAIATIVDIAEPIITIDSVSDTEGAAGETKDFVFTITLSQASDETVTVIVQTEDETGTAGEDYVALPPTVVTFAPGEIEKTVVVQVLGDNAWGLDETFRVVLSGAENAMIDTDAVGIGTIVNDDDLPSITISGPATFGEPDDPTQIFYEVTIDGEIESPLEISFTTEDITATAGEDYETASGTLVFEPGEAATQEIAVTILPDDLNEADEEFRVVLSVGGEEIASATTTIEDDEDPAPTISIESASVTEGDSGTKTLDFVVTLSRASGQTVTVDFSTVAGTATAGQDYQALSDTLTFAPGELTKTISIAIVGDTTVEEDETFEVVLDEESVTNASIEVATATGTIINDDFPVISIDAGAQVVEGNTGTSELVFTIRLSEEAPFEVTFDYATADGTATAGEDYQAANGSITFAPGETEKTITVLVIGDTIDEDDETVLLNVTNVVGATPASLSGAGTIVDDDTDPTVSIGNASVTEGDAGTQIMTFTVTLSENPTETVTVDYNTVDGTAVSSGPFADFVAKSGTLTFEPGGSLTQTIEIVINGDLLDEFDETFQVVLSNLQNAKPGALTGTGTIIDNDPEPILTIEGPTQVVEGAAGTTTEVEIVLRLSAPSGKVVSGVVATLGLTATEDVDYEGLFEEFVFAPGETEYRTTVTIIGDNVKEENETFLVGFPGVENAQVSETEELEITILDDDDGVKVSGVVYVDHDGNGKQENGEIGLPKQTVQLHLLGNNGEVLQTWTTTTDGNGHYEFTDVGAGRYAIVQIQDPDYTDGLVTYGTGGQNLSATNNRMEVIVSSNHLEGYNFGESGLTPAAISKKLKLSSRFG